MGVLPQLASTVVPVGCFPLTMPSCLNRIVLAIVIIPVEPSPYDVWAAKEIVDLITEVRVIKADLKAVFAVNRKIVGTAIGRDVAEALASYPVPVLGSAISQRVGFAESAAVGQTLLETEPSGSGAQEVRAVLAELMEMAA